VTGSRSVPKIQKNIPDPIGKFMTNIQNGVTTWNSGIMKFTNGAPLLCGKTKIFYPASMPMSESHATIKETRNSRMTQMALSKVHGNSFNTNHTDHAGALPRNFQKTPLAGSDSSSKSPVVVGSIGLVSSWDHPERDPVRIRIFVRSDVYNFKYQREFKEDDKVQKLFLT